MFSEAENFCGNLHFLLLTETDGNGQLNISMQHPSTTEIPLSVHPCNEDFEMGFFCPGKFLSQCIVRRRLNQFTFGCLSLRPKITYTHGPQGVSYRGYLYMSSDIYYHSLY